MGGGCTYVAPYQEIGCYEFIDRLGPSLKPSPKTWPKPITKFPLRHHIAAVYPTILPQCTAPQELFGGLYLS